MYCFKWESTKAEIFSVIDPMLFTIGLPGFPGLCIFGSM